MSETEKKIIECIESKYGIRFGDGSTIESVYNCLNGKGFSYDETINYLLSFDDQNIENEIWNSLWYLECKEEISKTGRFKELGEQYQYAKEKALNLGGNVTTDIISEHITLKRMNDSFSEYMVDQFEKCKVDEDFIYSVQNYLMPNRYVFVIIENGSENVVGYVGINNICYGPINSSYTYQNEYFILPDYRNKGYACEALSILSNAAFSHKIIESKDDEKMYVYKDKPVRIDMIYGFVDEENIASQKTQLASGYTHMGKICFIKEKLMKQEMFLKVKEDLKNEGMKEKENAKDS